jgi:glucose/arabinose dehydrogenase
MNRVLPILTLPALACGFLGIPESAARRAVSTMQPSMTPTLSCSSFPCGLQGTPTQAAPQRAPVEVPPSQISNAKTFPDPDDYEWVEIGRGLARPVDIQSAQDGAGLLFIVEKAGRVRILQNDRVLARAFLDIERRVLSADKEQGLLGIAFHPRYAENRKFYVNYTAAGSGDTVIARFETTDDLHAANPASEIVLLEIDQPFVNHNGGALAFGPDGYLYAALGDGGGIGDPFDHAQDTGSLLGKVLRLDVDRAEPYAIPSDNPFANEVWAYGFRNPWRFSFDPATGDLFVGDVGHLNWEEINYIPAGSPGGLNFGWDHYEGTHTYEPAGTPEAHAAPIVEYSHEAGCAVVGGLVYRGSMSEWNGIYLYGDYCLGTIWGLMDAGGNPQNQDLFNVRTTITTFGQDEAGEIYFASDQGSIHRFNRK